MKYFNICDFGAKEETLNTAAIQAAVDAAVKEQGTVVVPKGVYLTGTVNLRNVSLCIEKGGVIKGSPKLSDYPEIGFYHNEMGEVTSLLYTIDSDFLHIYGEGTIDCNGTSFYNTDIPAVPDYYDRDRMTEEQLAQCNYEFTDRVNQPLFFGRAENLTIEGITILDSSCWTMSFCHCRNIRLLNLNVDTSWHVPNNDGVHFSCSRDIFVKGCNFHTGDDCIAFTSTTDWEEACGNAVISDCIFRSCSKAVNLGYMYSCIRNITITNSIIQESNRGICMMVSEGQGVLENVTVSNMIIETAVRAGNWWGNGEPILIMGIQHDDGAVTCFRDMKPGRNVKYSIHNISISNVICRGENAIGIVASEGNVHNINLCNIFYKAKESKNIGLKGRVLDTNPSREFVPVEKDCFLKIKGTKAVTCARVTGDEEQGVDRIVWED